MTAITSETAAGVLLADTLTTLASLVARLPSARTMSTTSLATLTHLDREGEHRLSDLAAKARVSAPAMTRIVDRLTGHGLVNRHRSSRDARAVMVTITGKGREVLCQLRAERVNQVSNLLDELDHEELVGIEQARPALARLASLAARVRQP